MQQEQQIKQIKITKETYDKLSKHGRFQDTFDSVISRVLDQLDNKYSETDKI